MKPRHKCSKEAIVGTDRMPPCIPQRPGLTGCASNRNAEWLDQERAAKIRKINQGLPKNVADAAREPGAPE